MTEVEFRLPDPAYGAFQWTHNEHFSGSFTTLEVSLRALNPRMGEDGIPNAIYVNGYGFNRIAAPGAPRIPEDDSAVAGWRERHEPAIDEFRARIAAFDPSTVEAGSWRDTLVQCDKDLWAIFGPVHRDTVGQVLGPSARFVELYRERFGNDRAEEALAMLAGFPNASTARAAALWKAAQIAARHAEVLASARAGHLPEPTTDGARAFLAAWDEMLVPFGCTTTMHLMDGPTWAEDPATPIAMVVAMADDPDSRDPLEVEAAAAARREELLGALQALDTGSDEQVAEMLKVYSIARHMTPASEDHNLICDQQLIAAARAYWLKVGAWLVGLDRLASPDDIFHLTLDEIVAALEDGDVPSASVIAARREASVQWRSISPPATLGKRDIDESAPRTLRGIAASAGVYEGRARVIPSLPEASHLVSGDVLVCPATTPEWTPYFGVIGALVAGGGGLLTHAAVVAREFGIPAVVSAKDAVTAIPDGARVRVDGSTGIVTILE